MSKKGKAYLLMALMTMMVSGCIHNDIPYPRLQAGFSSIECENSIQAASIDSINRQVTFFLNEEADLANVKVTLFTLSPSGAYWTDSTRFAAGVDLRSKVFTYVSLYQDYTWTISAVQTIERYFTVENQIGASTIDVVGKRIVAYVPDHTDLKRVKVTSMKLGGPNATYDPDCVGEYCDFSGPFMIKVMEHGRTSTWTVYMEKTESSVAMERVDPWTCVAWLYASAQEGRENGFQYRRADSDVWIDVPDAWVTHNGGAISARLTGLTPMTDYVARAISGDEFSAEYDFQTEDTYDIPNGSMDYWWLDGKIWCPWPENGERWWDTGNKGATTLGSSNSYPITDTPSGTGQAACLETRFVGIGALGKLASGNLFVGYYARTDGTNGVLSLGREFSMHPTHLSGMFKYKTAPISSASGSFADLKGQPDTCIVWVALIDAPEPFELRTKPSDLKLFNPNAPDVVAYGKVEYGYDVESWTPFKVELQYRDTARKPRYILITASASKYGDYFVGANGAVMCIDDFRLEWDY